MRLLPPHDRQRLSTLALSMARIERGLSAQLPTPLTRRLLAQAAEQHALQQPKQYERWDQPFFVEHAWLNTASSLLTLAAGAASLIPLIEMIPMQAYLLCVPVCVCFLCDPNSTKQLFRGCWLQVLPCIFYFLLLPLTMGLIMLAALLWLLTDVCKCPEAYSMATLSFVGFVFHQFFFWKVVSD